MGRILRNQESYARVARGMVAFENMYSPLSDEMLDQIAADHDVVIDAFARFGDRLPEELSVHTSRGIMKTRGMVGGDALMDTHVLPLRSEVGVELHTVVSREFVSPGELVVLADGADFVCNDNEQLAEIERRIPTHARGVFAARPLFAAMVHAGEVLNMEDWQPRGYNFRVGEKYKHTRFLTSGRTYGAPRGVGADKPEIGAYEYLQVENNQDSAAIETAHCLSPIAYNYQCAKISRFNRIYVLHTDDEITHEGL